MKLIRNLVVVVVLLVLSLVCAVVAAETYRRVKYPEVPRHEADVFFDIGFVFLLTFIATAGATGGGWLLLRRRRAASEV